MKIITGKYKNIIIDSLKNSTYRPSTNKFRQGLFSILSSGEFIKKPAFLAADILDLFAGSGSLSFEALSRGAKSVTFIDCEVKHLQAIKIVAAKIHSLAQIKTIQADATRLPTTNKQYDLIFMDPPYQHNLIKKTLDSLVTNHYLKNQAIIAIELPKKIDILTDENYQLIKEKLYGNSKLLILRYEQK